MKVLVQWITDPPNNWIEIDSKDWPSLPKKPEPPVDRKPVYDDGKVIGFEGSAVVVDDQPGWIYQICIQGISFWGSHVAVVDKGNFVEVTVWNDDLRDQPKQEFTADVWRLYPDVVDRTYQDGNITYRFKGFLQEHSLYLGSALTKPNDMTSGGKTEVKAYRKFLKPDETTVRHGIWLLDSLLTELNKKVLFPSWREWL